MLSAVEEPHLRGEITVYSWSPLQMLKHPCRIRYRHPPSGQCSQWSHIVLEEGVRSLNNSDGMATPNVNPISSRDRTWQLVKTCEVSVPLFQDLGHRNLHFHRLPSWSCVMILLSVCLKTGSVEGWARTSGLASNWTSASLPFFSVSNLHLYLFS